MRHDAGFDLRVCDLHLLSHHGNQAARGVALRPIARMRDHGVHQIAGQGEVGGGHRIPLSLRLRSQGFHGTPIAAKEIDRIADGCAQSPQQHARAGSQQVLSGTQVGLRLLQAGIGRNGGFHGQIKRGTTESVPPVCRHGCRREALRNAVCRGGLRNFTVTKIAIDARRRRCMKIRPDGAARNHKRDAYRPRRRFHDAPCR
ncbi:hypothetical protein DL770_011159 [Monosporascus sp. CRB-9-2]|nr:hypothetical protein DL770_011159 [Monosporascus sp. CRB-9-2]